jgi:chemotaxis protein CheC
MKDELDILREVGSIAASHGSIALSEILGKKINLLLPSVDIVTSAGISTRIDVAKAGIAVISRFASGLKGESVFLLDEHNAFKLVGLSYKIEEEYKNLDVLTEVGLSAIKEIGNIVTSAYLSAIGMILKKVVLALPPTLISGTFDEILNIIVSSSENDGYALLIEAVFEEPQEKIRGGFYLVLAQSAATDIQNACKRILAEIAK